MSKKSNLERKKKKQVFTKAKRNKQSIPDNNEIHPELLKRINEKEFAGKKIKIIKLKKKASQIILDFAGPLMDEAFDNEEVEQALNFAIVGWNLGAMPDDLRNEALEKISSEISADGMEKRIILGLIERKVAMFKEYNFIIDDYQIEFKEGGGLYLSVVAIVLEK